VRRRPGQTACDYGVGIDDKLSGASDQSLFVRFSPRDQTPIDGGAHSHAWDAVDEIEPFGESAAQGLLSSRSSASISIGVT
jgi:hypothetical protein